MYETGVQLLTFGSSPRYQLSLVLLILQGTVVWDFGQRSQKSCPRRCKSYGFDASTPALGVCYQIRTNSFSYRFLNRNLQHRRIRAIVFFSPSVQISAQTFRYAIQASSAALQNNPFLRIDSRSRTGQYDSRYQCLASLSRR